MQFDNISKCYRMDKIILQYKALINFQCPLYTVNR